MRYMVVCRQDGNTQSVAEQVRSTLDAAGWIHCEDDPQLVICIGGDGTLLYGVHQYMHSVNDLMFLGIHTGTLGFFTDYTQDELDLCLNDLLHKTPQIFSSRLLKIEVDTMCDPFYALNEMFESCRGSGICLSTQAGSTALNRSLKGAVIDSGLSVMQLAEITPIQHSKHRSLGNPYIMMETRKVRIVSDDFQTALLGYDHKSVPLLNAREVKVAMSDKLVHFARYRQYSYLKRLKNLY